MYRAILICANGNEYCDSKLYDTEDEAWVTGYEAKLFNSYCEPNEGGLVVDFRVEEE